MQFQLEQDHQLKLQQQQQQHQKLQFQTQQQQQQQPQIRLALKRHHANSRCSMHPSSKLSHQANANTTFSERMNIGQESCSKEPEKFPSYPTENYSNKSAAASHRSLAMPESISVSSQNQQSFGQDPVLNQNKSQTKPTASSFLVQAHQGVGSSDVARGMEKYHPLSKPYMSQGIYAAQSSNFSADFDVQETNEMKRLHYGMISNSNPNQLLSGNEHVHKLYYDPQQSPTNYIAAVGMGKNESFGKSYPSQRFLYSEATPYLPKAIDWNMTPQEPLRGNPTAVHVGENEYIGKTHQSKRSLFEAPAFNDRNMTPQPSSNRTTSNCFESTHNNTQPFSKTKISVEAYSNQADQNTSATNLTSWRNPNPPDPSTFQNQPLSNQTTPECAPNEVVRSPYGFYSGFDLLPNQLPILADPLQFGVLNRCQTRGEVEHQNYNHHPLNPAQPANIYPDSFHRSPGASQQVTTLSSTVVPKNSQVESFLYNSNFWD